MECKNYIVQREKLKQGLKRLLPLLIGQCVDALKAKLRIQSNFKRLKDGGSIIKFIKSVK